MKFYSKENCYDALREADISTACLLDDVAVNPQFSGNNSGKYSIWLYKGGPNCYHKWTRVVYFRKRNPDGTFMPNQGLANDKRVSESNARSQGFSPPDIGKAGVAPKDMKHQGYKTAKKNKK